MPPTIIADFVLGKTGNRIAVALARETVAAARLYGGKKSWQATVAQRSSKKDGQRRGKVAGKQDRQARRPAKSAALVMCNVTQDNLKLPRVRERRNHENIRL